MAVTLDLQRRDFGWDGVHLSKQGYETLEDIIRKETEHLWP
jgi:lysophospholipase L1-like esterase